MFATPTNRDKVRVYLLVKRCLGADERPANVIPAKQAYQC
ncbi:hypothetical protein Nizo2264_0746 [Lactiplantibacillus plantarum]|nr:hypothetical protein Nizo2264_0746 [Lactiplantibacillus plantarum]